MVNIRDNQTTTNLSTTSSEIYVHTGRKTIKRIAIALILFQLIGCAKQPTIVNKQPTKKEAKPTQEETKTREETPTPKPSIFTVKKHRNSRNFNSRNINIKNNILLILQAQI
jgi:hypothetical protein